MVFFFWGGIASCHMEQTKQLLNPEFQQLPIMVPPPKRAQEGAAGARVLQVHSGGGTSLPGRCLAQKPGASQPLTTVQVVLHVLMCFPQAAVQQVQKTRCATPTPGKPAA